MTQRPFTPDSLAARWGISAESVRALCRQATLPHFRIGKLYRIPAHAVEDYEQAWQQTSASDDTEEDSASTGAIRELEDESAISLRHAPERKRKQRR